MHPIVLAAMWWFLAGPPVTSPNTSVSSITYTGPVIITGRCYGETDTTLPKAVGPFPTEEMCRQAEYQVNPTNKSLWNAKATKLNADYAIAIAAYDSDVTHYKAVMRGWLAANYSKGHYHSPDNKYHFQVFDAADGNDSELEVLLNDPGIRFYSTPPLAIESIQFWNQLVPRRPDPLPTDTYSIAAPCELIKGWYSRDR